MADFAHGFVLQLGFPRFDEGEEGDLLGGDEAGVDC